jgi:formylglycine-generating enzyme required for sulfatase activity
VLPIPVATVTVSPSSASLTVGQTQQLTATPKDAGGNALTGRTVTWTSAAPSVAAIDALSGVVTAASAGTTAITATSEGKTGTAAITVTGGTGSIVCAGTPQLGCGLALDQFSLIQPGTFQMGSDAGYYPNEAPVHSVTISRSFYMQKTEVTQGQWRAVMGANPAYFGSCGDMCPVERVRWDDIQTFLQRLNALTPGVTYRLPTEAEWEYAARAGTTGDTYGTLEAIAWFSGNASSRTHAVAGKAANAWGLYDMIGNVWEWVNDWYGSYSSASLTDPTGPATGTDHILRGGSWYYPSINNRASNRLYTDSSSWSTFFGFRLVRTP